MVIRSYLRLRVRSPGVKSCHSQLVNRIATRFPYLFKENEKTHKGEDSRLDSSVSLFYEEEIKVCSVSRTVYHRLSTPSFCSGTLDMCEQRQKYLIIHDRLG